MRRLLTFTILFALSGGPYATADGSHSTNVSIRTDDDSRNVTDCSQIRVTYDDESALRSEETLSPGALRSLKVRTSRNGGVRVVGWDQPTYSVKICKAAALASDLSDIRASLRGDELTATGPDSGRWLAFFLVRVPRNAVLDLESNNGEISVSDVTDATLTAHAQNGPVSLRNTSGTIDASTQNGPISYSGNSGTVKLAAQNGPISIKLLGSGWDRGGLDARTNNGPLSLKLPRSFRSGVVVSSDGRAPISCHADGCERFRRTSSDDDDDFGGRPREIELRSGTPVVRLATHNGPVSVKDAD
jgi:hypothetical protein